VNKWIGRNYSRLYIEMREPVFELLDKLHKFGWDSEQPLATLTPEHVIAVLEKYVDGHTNVGNSPRMG
jgi:hypothetical protein